MIDIIKENEKLIFSIINKYTYYFDKDDLYQVGVIGIINAYKNYKENTNTKFSTYAYFYILGEVKKYIRENNNIKISKEVVSLNKKIIEAKEILTQKLKKEITDYEVSIFLEIPESLILEVNTATSIMKSLDEDESLYNIKGCSSNIDDLIDLNTEINNLDELEQNIIKNRYMNDMTQKDVSKLLGISQVKVCRSEDKILQRLRTRLK